nr:BatD family protein [Paraglaciecola sp. G1-23]
MSGSVQAQQVEVTASVDKNPVMVDESFNLTIVANGDVDRGAFDSSALLKDFTVGRTSVSSQTQMINFTTTRSTTWTTTIIPKKRGIYTIPAFDIAGSKTKEIDLVVVPVTAGKSSQGRDLFITTDVDVDKVYLQQQVHYTVKLHLAKDLQRGSLSSPTLENADIRQIGKDKEYNEIVDGKRYRIIERSFAIIPQQSGTFNIEGPLFEGEVVDNSRQSFGFFNRSKAVNRVGPAQQIEVLPIPSNYNEHWLPSEFVQIDDEWQGKDGDYIAGEPITRTMTLTAIGVIEEQLPELNSQYPNTVKTYPDQAETTTIEKDNTLISQRKESIAIIPSQAGKLTIPEVKIPWFNTITQKTEYATLPAKTIQVVPAATQSGSALPIAPTLAPAANSTPEPSNTNTQSIVQITGVEQYWQWLSISLLVLWLVTLVAWWKHATSFKGKRQSKPSTVRTSDNEKTAWKALEKSLNTGRAQDIHNQLTTWLAHLTKDKNATLEQNLKRVNNPVLTQHIDELLAARYAKSQASWQSTELHQVLREVRKSWSQQDKASSSLQPLYPNG